MNPRDQGPTLIEVGTRGERSCPFRPEKVKWGRFSLFSSRSSFIVFRVARTPLGP